MNIIQRLIASGADLSTKKALKSALNMIGADPVNVDKIYVEVKNSRYNEEFKKIPAKDKIIFLPQCLRHPTKCKAKPGKYGFECQHCGECKNMPCEILIKFHDPDLTKFDQEISIKLRHQDLKIRKKIGTEEWLVLKEKRSGKHK